MNERLPNILTISRIFLIPFIVGSFIVGGRYFLLTAFFFLLAAITDLVDGYLARSFSLESDFGRVFDPIADKMLVATAVILIAGHLNSDSITICGIIIIMREFLVSGMREYTNSVQSRVLSANFFGKVKAFLQMTSIVIIFISFSQVNLLNIDYKILYKIGEIFFYIAAVMTFFSAAIYVYNVLQVAKQRSL